MRKIIFLLVALLFVSVGNAQAWFAADARTTENAANVKIPVYNNASADLDVGDVVVWDIDASTGDNDLYVTTTTTADTTLVAGVIANACTDGNVCNLIVYGFAECDTGTTAGDSVAENGPICTSTTAGGGTGCNNADFRGQYAIATAAIGFAGQGNCFVNIK